MLNRRPELATNAMKDPGVPHPRNDQPSPCHFGRRPRSTQLAQAPATKTKDLCSANPGATGPHVGNPTLTLCIAQRIDGALHGVVLPPHLPGDGKSPGQDSLPKPPAKGMGDDRAATRLFSWDAQGTQWHRCQPITKGILHISINYTSRPLYGGGSGVCLYFVYVYIVL